MFRYLSNTVQRSGVGRPSYLRLLPSRYISMKSSNPLRPSVPANDLGLPLEPQSIPLRPIASSTIKSSDLARLHRLSALTPPLKDSEEERDLLRGLNELVGLMEVVKDVQLPQGSEAMGELLTQGVGEVVIGEDTVMERDEGKAGGRELLGWATSRKGDYYHSKAAKKV